MNSLVKVKLSSQIISPFPSLIEIETCVNDLASLNEKVNQGNINLLIKLQDRFVRLKKSMILLGTFVAIKSEGNESVVLSSGFTVSENQECHEDLVII